jgi:hypothetical protein
MNLSNTFLIAAVAGILSGVAGCGANEPKANDPSATSASGGGDQAIDKHACKGQNSCKGKGGCKTDQHGCKGQNACKGQGGCKTV